MELLDPSSKNKKIQPDKNSLYFLKRKLFLYFWKWNPALFSPSSKNKKNPPQENYLYSNIKRFPIFSQKKAFLIFLETETQKKIPYISGSNFPSSKNEKNHS